jgi:UDP:flavonoid glycosyltransferase YjiC (YdhE family)
MRILFSTVPVFGHFLPMAPLVDAARRAGHEVVVASGADLEVEVARLGVEFWRTGPSFAESVAVRGPETSESASPEERIAADVAAIFLPAARARAEDLVPRAARWRPDLVVHEPSELAGAVAAAESGAGHAVHGLGLWASGFWSLLGPGYAELCARWSVPDRFLDAHYLDPMPRGLQPGGPADFRHVLPLRPVAPPTPPGATPPLLDERFPDTVYLTLGTIFHDAPEVFRAVLDGLATVPVNVIVTVGPGADPAVLGPRPSHVHVTAFVPQELVLPRCGLAIHHGGAGSMLGALRHGLPQLVLPRGADNFHNAALAGAAGVALSLEPDRVDARAVADAVSRLLTEPAFRTAARRIRAEIATMPAPEEVLTAVTGAHTVRA